MKTKLFAAVALLVLGATLGVSSARAQSGTYTQVAPAQGRSGELNFFNVGLKDSSGILRGNYTLQCNTNAINNFTCSFNLVLDDVTYNGKVTLVTTYFPANDVDSDDHGPFAYNWSVTGNGVTLTGSHQGQGRWGSCGRSGCSAFIDTSTVTVQ